MKDGKENIRYILLDATHAKYDALITKFTKLHTDKESGNKLTVIMRNDNKRALVKVVGHVGWIQDLKARMDADRLSGLILKVRNYNALPQVTELLARPAWRKANES